MRRTLTNPTTVTTLAASAVMFLPLTSGAQESRIISTFRPHDLHAQQRERALLYLLVHVLLE